MPRFFASCPIGLEELLADELANLGGQELKNTIAGVHFSGTFATAWRALMWSRLASRILYPLAAFEAPDPEALYQGIAAIDWSEHMAAGGSLMVDVRLSRSTVSHTRFAAQKVKDAVVDQFRAGSGRRPSVDTTDPDLRINLQLKQNHASVSVDLGGALAQRGYRLSGGGAPLRENLAAAILIRAGWPELAAAGACLLDPLCGSGTLLIEGAMMAADIAPGLGRPARFGWRGFDAAIWAEVMREAKDRRQAAAKPGTILGFDGDRRVLEQARENLARAGLTGRIQLAARRLEEWPAVSESLPSAGLLVTNPPYGERMGELAELTTLYAGLGALLRDRFEGWRAAVFTGRPQLGKQMGIRAHKRYKLYNGPLPCELLCFEVAPKRYVRAAAGRQMPLAQGGAVVISDGAEMFANRLKKNLKRFRKWAAREGVSCYRIYDADMPEYNVAVELFESHALISEYPAPAELPLDVTRSRLHDILLVVPEVLDLPRERVVFREQHAKGRPGAPVPVTLDGYHFELDLGLPGGALQLDMRPIHRLIGELAGGKRFLNLYAGNGAASVYARGGGARATDTVESNPFLLERARIHLARNGGAGKAHVCHRAEPLPWLQDARPFDLILFNAPGQILAGEGRTLHSARDHLALIQSAARRLAGRGVLLFVVRHRKFKLDQEGLAEAGLKGEDITSIPEDCARHPHALRCFKVMRA